MSIAALITGGLGPGGSIKYVMTRGYDIGAAIIIPFCYQEVSATVRNGLSAIATLSNATIEISGDISNATVSTQSDLC